MGIVFLFERFWTFGGFLVLVSFLLSVVGQGLPHRQRQTAHELYTERVGQGFGKITPEESTGLAKALMVTGFLIGLVGGATAMHKDLAWYWALACTVALWLLFPTASTAFCYTWFRMVERAHGETHDP